MLIEKSFTCLNPVLTPNFVRKTPRKGHNGYIYINDILTFISCTVHLAEFANGYCSNLGKFFLTSVKYTARSASRIRDCFPFYFSSFISSAAVVTNFVVYSSSFGLHYLLRECPTGVKVYLGHDSALRVSNKTTILTSTITSSIGNNNSFGYLRLSRSPTTYEKRG